MRSKLYCIIFLFTSLNLFSQSQTYQINQNFNRIKITNKIKAEVILNDSENKVVVNGIGAEDLKISVNNGELKLSLPIDELFSRSNTRIKLYVTDFIELKLNNGAEVEINNKLKQDNLTLDLSEGSFLSAELDLKSLNLKSITGSEAQIRGKTDEQFITIKTGGIVEAQYFESQTTDVSVSYGGSAEVYASQKIKAKVTAGGNIKVFGNPSSVNQKTRFGGQIQLVN